MLLAADWSDRQTNVYGIYHVLQHAAVKKNSDKCGKVYHFQFLKKREKTQSGTCCNKMSCQ